MGMGMSQNQETPQIYSIPTKTNNFREIGEVSGNFWDICEQNSQDKF